MSFLDDMDYKRTLWDKVTLPFVRLGNKIKDAYYEVVYLKQKVFRGFSDKEVWNFNSEMAHIMLPRLVYLKKTKYGYPIDFCDYDDSSGWRTREEYDQDIADGKIVGGGEKAWDEVLDKIIFSLSWVIKETSWPRTKLEKKLIKEIDDTYGRVDAEIPEYGVTIANHVYVNEQEKRDDSAIGGVWVPESNYSEEVHQEYLDKGLTYKGFKKKENAFYYNRDLEKQLYDKCQEGLDLMAKYFWNLSD